MSKKNTRNALDTSLSYAVIGLDLAKADCAVAAVPCSDDDLGLIDRMDYESLFEPLKSSKAPTNYFTPNILRKSWSRLVVSVVHLDALAFPVAAT